MTLAQRIAQLDARRPRLRYARGETRGCIHHVGGLLRMRVVHRLGAYTGGVW